MINYISRSKVDAKEINFEDEYDINEFDFFVGNMDDGYLLDFLKENYSYIYDAMLEEKYEIEEKYCVVFHEVVFDDKVVGFYTCDYIILDRIEKISIDEFYVVPEYRGNKIFIDTLKDLIRSNEYDKIVLRNPSRLIIEILLENGLARRFSRNLVRTGIKLSTRLNKIVKNKKLNKLYVNLPDDVSQMTYLGNVYDMNINSIAFYDSMEIFSLYDDIIVLSSPRRCDYQKYHLSKKIRSIDKRYVKNIYKNIRSSWDELQDFQEDVDSQLGKKKDVDFYLGSLDELSVMVEVLMEDGVLTKDSFIIIKDKLQQALDSNEISFDNISTRFLYLLDNPDKEAVVTGSVKQGYCPYCNESEFEEGVCVICGYNLFDKKIESIRRELSERIDSQTGVYKSLLDTIDEEGLDKQTVINDQIEISACQLLNFLSQQSNYSSLPNFDDNNKVSEQRYIQYLKENGYIELKENTNRNDEKEFMDMLRQTGGIPSLRAYKSHMHRDYIYKITKKGRKHSIQNKVARIYIDNIINLPYYKFKKFYQENKDTLEEIELLKEYAQMEENEIIKKMDIEEYNNLCLTNINILTKEDNEELLINLIKSLICRLNYYLLSLDNENFAETPVDAYNEVFVMEYWYLIDDYDYDVLFENAFESIGIDKLKNNREMLYEDIKMILNEENMGELNRSLAIKYRQL